MVDYREGLSILELIVYLPALFISLLMGWRHGFGRSAGWYFFILFTLIRIIGNGCYLGTINNPNNINLYIAYGVCNSIGLSPLLMGMLAQLSRVNDSVQRTTGSGFWPQLFRIFGLLSLVALILSIVGMTTTDDLANGLHQPETKAGIAIFIVTWAGLMVLDLLLWLRYDSIEKGEHRLLVAITICAPIMLIRIIYSCLAVFTHDIKFNMFEGNTTVFLVMDVLEEIFIVYTMIVTGLTLQQREKAVYGADKESQGASSAQYSNVEMQGQNGSATQQTESEAGRPPKRKIRGGPIMMLIAFIINKRNGY